MRLTKFIKIMAFSSILSLSSSLSLAYPYGNSNVYILPQPFTYPEVTKPFYVEELLRDSNSVQPGDYLDELMASRQKADEALSRSLAQATGDTSFLTNGVTGAGGRAGYGSNSTQLLSNSMYQMSRDIQREQLERQKLMLQERELALREALFAAQQQATQNRAQTGVPTSLDQLSEEEYEALEQQVEMIVAEKMFSLKTQMAREIVESYEQECVCPNSFDKKGQLCTPEKTLYYKAEPNNRPICFPQQIEGKMVSEWLESKGIK